MKIPDIMTNDTDIGSDNSPVSKLLVQLFIAAVGAAVFTVASLSHGRRSWNHGRQNNQKLSFHDENNMSSVFDQDTTVACEESMVPLLRNANIDPGDINRLRRIVAMDDPSCFEKHFAIFADYFSDRINEVKNHLFLHIPKAGGTSICFIAKNSNKEISSDSNNCWEREHFRPLWCCGEFEDRPFWQSCKELDGALPEFVMDENFLDYPLCMQHRIYSMLIRDPVDRAVSHRSHLDKFKAQGKLGDSYPKRLDLGLHNYFSWALSAGMNNGSKISFVPELENLKLAMDTMSRFDFLVDLFHNSTCNLKILGLMGFSNVTELPNENEKPGETSKPTDKEKLENFNSLDRKLYEYAMRIVNVDCDFFLRL
ncbi:hypothetical protein ACHAXS_008942 [Conticribra weissflogii]